MNSKKSQLLFANLLIIVVLIVAVLALHRILGDVLGSSLLLDFILVVASAFAYIFLAIPLTDSFLTSDKKLKTMIDETLHELNTPIATIEANISMLRKSIKDEKNLKRLNRIKDASQNLTKLYQSIEYNIKENIEQIDKNTFDLYQEIENCISKFQEIKDEIIITNKIPKTEITTDKNGFLKTIENLISNAIKYNKKNGFIHIYLKDKVLHIQDSGIGIDTKNLFIIFEKSFQENPTTKGYGIGLGIVKSFCDKNKINIKIDTKKDKGTTIKLDLSKIIV